MLSAGLVIVVVVVGDVGVGVQVGGNALQLLIGGRGFLRQDVGRFGGRVGGRGVLIGGALDVQKGCWYVVVKVIILPSLLPGLGLKACKQSNT